MMEQPLRPSPALASYHPDDETAKRLSDFLRKAPEYIPPFIVDPTTGQVIPNPKAQKQNPPDPGVEPGLGGLREYNDRTPMQPGYIRP